jgi:hypothetical protein
MLIEKFSSIPLKRSASQLNEYEFLCGFSDILRRGDPCRGDGCKQLLAKSLNILDFSFGRVFGGWL